MASGINSNATRPNGKPDADDTRRPTLASRRHFRERFASSVRRRSATRVLALDEARFGLKGWFRRRWSPRGERPPWMVADRSQWTWLYTAVEPTTAWSFSLLLPDTTGHCFTLFLQELRQALGADRAALVRDNSDSHTSKQVD